MLLAEDLLLLATDDTTGRLVVPTAQLDLALGGANLLELTLLEKVDVTGPADGGPPGRLVVRDASPTGDPILDGAMGVLTAHRGKRPKAAIRPLSRKLRPALRDRLVRAGVLQAVHTKLLGVFPVRRWPAADPRPQAELRQRMAQVLVHGLAPDARTAALVALAHAMKATHKLLPPSEHGLSRRELSRRAAAIAEGSWASEAVRKAIQEMTAALVAAVAAGGAAAGS